jgi:S-formylglutathione hydrolase FrmB
MRKQIFLILLILAIFQLSIWGQNTDYKSQVKPGEWLRNVQLDYTFEEKQGSGLMQIYFPKDYDRSSKFRTLIVLHGYGHNMKDWEKNTSIKSYADKHKFVLVCPDMGKTLYETKYYPETVNKWGPMPGGLYIGDALVYFLRKEFGLAKSGKVTGIFGLSTGGRGAVLVAAKYPDRFGAAAGLSGDYDPLAMTRDRLLTSVYGDFKKFEERWKTDDNIIGLAVNLANIPVFISHGAKDSVVPKEQSLMLAIKLRQLKKSTKGDYVVQYKELAYSMHDWTYWARMVPEMFEFFDKNLK